MAAYAELIGDPVAHSLSPAIHGFWLEALRLDGEYRATRVAGDQLGDYFAARRRDPAWRGCNVTAPHKCAALPYLDALDPAVAAIGAVNHVIVSEGRLIGRNSDVAGIGEALGAARLEGRAATLIGAGGAARAAIFWLRAAGAAEIRMVARRPDALEIELKAQGKAKLRAFTFACAAGALAGTSVLINATPLGMRGAPPMPRAVLEALRWIRAGACIFDMVYDPLETELLAVARRLALPRATGLAMLVGQAAPAFAGFFGSSPPRVRDAELLGRLETGLARRIAGARKEECGEPMA